MKKLAFFMNVDIAWIKQRPHFIAEIISNYYDTTVFYPYFYNRTVLVHNSGNYPFRIRRIYRVPNAIKLKIVHNIGQAISIVFVKLYLAFFTPDVIFVSDPKQVGYIPHNFKGKVVYDCMDDLVALATYEEERQRVLYYEKELTEKADLIIVSSNELIRVLNKRYEISDNIHLCRNAYSGKMYFDKIVETSTSHMFRICYFGTISSWFDVDLIGKSLEVFSDIEYVFAGPIVENVILPESDRIKYRGVVSHDELENIVKEVDCFIMPFIVNEVIKSVDPVKFYEYISFNKDILSIKYEEIERFSPFVYFYNNETEFFEAIQMIRKLGRTKYSIEEKNSFLLENTWEKRVENIVGWIENG